TFPVGAGTASGVPAAFDTNTWSCTTVPATTEVATPDAAMTSVRTEAPAHSFVAGPEFAPLPFVCRVSETPPTDGVAWALTTVVPVVLEASVIVQLPVPPEVVHGLGEVNEPGPETMLKLIEVPSGALT